MTKILVTGGTGFIGSRLIRFLCFQGYEVRVLCRPTSSKDELHNLPVKIITGDILDKHSLEQAVEGCDHVFHLAGYAKNWAKDPSIFYRVNVIGTKNVLQAAKKAGVKKVVVTSTCMTLGPSQGMPKEETDKRSGGYFCDYERTKCMAEELVKQFTQEGMPVVMVNPTRVYGPGPLTEGNSVTKMIALYLEGKWRLLLSGGRAKGNYVYVEDVVNGHWLALQKGKPGEKYLLSGENISLEDFFQDLAEAAHKYFQMVKVPKWLALTAAKIMASMAAGFGVHPLITPEWVRIFALDWAFSARKAETELGYKITPLRQGLQMTLDWLTLSGNSLKEVSR